MNEECRCCHSDDTKLVQTVREPDGIIDVMVCNNCVAQFEVKYKDPIVVVTSKPLTGEPNTKVTVRSVSTGAELDAVVDNDGIVRTVEGESITANSFEIVE